VKKSHFTLEWYMAENQTEMAMKGLIAEILKIEWKMRFTWPTT